ncbi:MAG: ABC transporter permease [Clostridiales bacterium]|nr:ABC transporter permease [Clostridiales bacterium]
MKKTSFFQKAGTRSVLASVISILFGLAAGSLLVFIVGIFNPRMTPKNIWEGIQLIFGGLFSTGRSETGLLTFGFNPTNIGNMLFRATPLVLTGLSVAVAFKTGLFNIGAPGQYLAGTAATLFIALGIPSSEMIIPGIAPTGIPPMVVWVLAFLGGMLAGALWGAIPGLLKSLLNINEVLACIMTNWIAANLVTWAFDVSNLKNIMEGTKTGYIYKTTVNGVATPKLGLDKLFPGSQVNGGIIIAAILAVIVYIILTRTTFGYQLKACGSNRFAARYAGIKDKRNIVLSMAIAGALAGAAGSLYYLSGNTEFFWSTYQQLPAAGFNGIPVALLASNHPIGVVFTGMFMSMLDICGLQLTNLTTYNEYITDVIIAVIVYLSAFSLLIKTWLSGRKKKKDTVPEAAPVAQTGEETLSGDSAPEGSPADIPETPTTEEAIPDAAVQDEPAQDPVQEALIEEEAKTE